MSKKLETYVNVEDDGADVSIHHSVYKRDGDDAIISESTTFSDLLGSYIAMNSIPSTPPTFRQSHKDEILETFYMMMSDVATAIAMVKEGKMWVGDNVQASSRTVRVVRYIRPSWCYTDHDNMGGVTILFEFVNRDDRSYGGPDDTLKISYAIAAPSDNFDKVAGRMLCEGRMDLGMFIEVPYNRNADLISNFLNNAEGLIPVRDVKNIVQWVAVS